MFSGNMVSQLIPFLMAPVLTRIFTKEEFAIQGSFLAFAGMIGIVAAGRLEVAIPISKEKKGAQEIVFTSLVLTVILSTLSLVFPLFKDFFADVAGIPEMADVFILIPLAVFSIGLFGIVNNWVIRHRNYGIISVGKISQSIVNSGLAALLGYIGWGANGLIAGWLISQFVSVLVLTISVDKKVSWKGYNITTIKSTVKEYKDFPLINSLHAFTDKFVSEVLLFSVIATGFGAAELGLFIIMNKYVKRPIGLITESVSTIFLAEASTAINEGKSAVPIFRKTLLTSGAFSLPFILVLFLFGPVLFGWYLGEDWSIAGDYARRLVPILFLIFIVSPVSHIPVLLNKQRPAYVIATIGHVGSLCVLLIFSSLNWDFIDALTMYAIAYSFMQAVYLIWMYTLIKKHHESTR